MGDSKQVSGDIRTKVAWSQAVGVAHRQFGVISLEQLLAAGISEWQVRRLSEKGHLHPLHRGVFAVGHRQLIDHAHLIAALLACGPGAFLSHRTAAAVWGLRPVALKAIEVTVAPSKGGRRRGLIIHRPASDAHPDELTTRNGLRVSSVARLLIELAPRERESELNRLITLAARKQVLDPEKVAAAIAAHPRRPGIAKLTRALAGYLPQPDRKSELERAFDRALAENPDIPPPLRNVVIEGWEIDCYWPERRVAVELDGRPYHVAVRDTEKDRYKDAKLLTMGIAPLRFTDRRFEFDQRGCLDDLRALLQLGGRLAQQ